MFIEKNFDNGYKIMDRKINELIIRKINEKDIPLCAKTMSETDPWITLKRDYQACADVLSDPSMETYVGFFDDKITGFIVITIAGSFRGYIKTVCVLPEWRGKGIGTELIGFVEERIFKESPNVFICVSSFNKNARKLYERLGYEMVGELKNYLVSGHSEFLMRKTTGPLSEFQKKL